MSKPVASITVTALDPSRPISSKMHLDNRPQELQHKLPAVVEHALLRNGGHVQEHDVSRLALLPQVRQA